MVVLTQNELAQIHGGFAEGLMVEGGLAAIGLSMEAAKWIMFGVAVIALGYGIYSLI